MRKFDKACQPGFIVKGKTVFLPNRCEKLSASLEMSQAYNTLVLTGKDLLELDVVPVMDFIDRLEKEAARFDKLVDSIHMEAVGTKSSSRKNSSTEKWLTNGNCDEDDRVDSAQSWGIFG